MINETALNNFFTLHELVKELADTYVGGSYRAFGKAQNWFENKMNIQNMFRLKAMGDYSGIECLADDAFFDKCVKTLRHEIVRKKNLAMNKIIDHIGEMSIRDFRSKIEELTNGKVCVNGGKAYLHIYNWLYKDGKRTRYRCRNYYIAIGSGFSRTEENAKVIADKCMKYAAIENYGQSEEVNVEKF